MKYDGFVKVFNDFIILSLSKAVYKKENVCLFKNIIKVEPSERDEETLTFIATNGIMMNIVELSKELVLKKDLSVGLWRVVKKTKSKLWLARIKDSEAEKIQYPDWKKVLTNHVSNYTTDIFIKYKSNKFEEYLKLFKNFPQQTAMDFKYLKKIPINIQYEVIWQSPTKPIIFKSNFTSIVMPKEAYNE